jgi:hypothetical protein
MPPPELPTRQGTPGDLRAWRRHLDKLEIAGTWKPPGTATVVFPTTGWQIQALKPRCNASVGRYFQLVEHSPHGREIGCRLARAVKLNTSQGIGLTILLEDCQCKILINFN